jgi:tRNA threonylcarbamoyl adenosine modification protein YjeE
MGSGKSTFARAFLSELEIHRDAEGSPTFAIAHEYSSRENWRVVHADGFRLKSETELEATGLVEVLWDPDALVLFEWLELFPETERALRVSPLWTIWIRLGFVEGVSDLRTIVTSQTGR